MACNLWLKAPKRQFNSCPSIRFGSFGNGSRLYYHIATAIYSWTSFYHYFTIYFGVHLPRVVINRHNIHVQMNHSFRSCRAQDSKPSKFEGWQFWPQMLISRMSMGMGISFYPRLRLLCSEQPLQVGSVNYAHLLMIPLRAILQDTGSIVWYRRSHSFHWSWTNSSCSLTPKGILKIKPTNPDRRPSKILPIQLVQWNRRLPVWVSWSEMRCLPLAQVGIGLIVTQKLRPAENPPRNWVSQFLGGFQKGP